MTCGGTATFDDKNVGTGKTVTVTGSTLTGARRRQLHPDAAATTATANITALALTATVTAANKDLRRHDRGDGAHLRVTGVVGATCVHLRRHGDVRHTSVGTGKTVTVTGAALSGADAGNYTLADDGDDDGEHHGGGADAAAHGEQQGLRRDDRGDGATCALTGAIGTDVVTCAGTATFDTALSAPARRSR